MKIIKQINESDFVIRMEDSDLNLHKDWVSNERLIVMHDYVRFDAIQHIETDPREVKNNIYGKFAGAANTVKFQSMVQLGIRGFKYAMLPLLLKHKYLQEDHFALRESGHYGYTYDYEAIEYSNEYGNTMVTFRLKNQTSWSVVTKELFDTLIYPSIVKQEEDKIKNYVNSKKL